jgi:Mn-containing catalase
MKNRNVKNLQDLLGQLRGELAAFARLWVQFLELRKKKNSSELCCTTPCKFL